jgi:hypothetical protein
MAMKSKNNEQISFDELIADTEFDYEEEKTYTTISGKDYIDVQTYEKYGMYDFEVGDEITGVPEIRHFENKDKKYDSLRVRIIDDTSDEYADLYINIPKPDKDGFITNINKSFDFYRTAFDFLFSVLRCRDESNVINNNGEEKNHFGKVNIILFAKYVDQMTRINVKITEGNHTSDYNSWIITQME